jgi:hypothetical protein
MNKIIGIVLFFSVSYCLADSLTIDYKTEYFKLKEIDSLSIKLSDNVSKYYELNKHLLGEGFNISEELKYSRNINSLKSVKYFKIYSGMTWYSLIGLLGSGTALCVMFSYDPSSDFPNNSPNFDVPARICGGILATIPLSLTFRVYFHRKAVIQYNKDLKEYIDNKYEN